MKFDEFTRIERCEDLPGPRGYEPGVMYIKDDFFFGFACPCGCERVTVLPGDTWGCTISDDDKPTIAPSIKCIGGCESHYWIRGGKVVWC